MFRFFVAEEYGAQLGRGIISKASVERYRNKVELMSSNLAFWRTRRSGRNSLFLTILVVSVLIVASIVYMVVRRQSSLPSIDSPGYAETLKFFNVGVAAILVDQYHFFKIN